MKNRRGVNVYNTTSPRTCDVLNVLGRKLANPMGKYNLQCFTWNTPSLSPLQKWLLYSSPSSGAFKQLINHRLHFATHSGTHVLTLVSDGSDSCTTRSPGPPFCHHPSLSEWSGLASPSAPTPVEGTRAPSCPPRSPPLSLQPPSAGAVSGRTAVRGPIAAPLRGCGGDVAGALPHLQSCKSREEGMLTRTLDTTSSVTGEANETVSKSRTGDLPAGGKPPPRESCPRRRCARGVPGHSTEGGAARGARRARAARTALWQLHQQVRLLGVTPAATGHSEDVRGAEAVWKPGLKLSSLPPCPAAWRRGWLELAVSVHLKPQRCP